MNRMLDASRQHVLIAGSLLLFGLAPRLPAGEIEWVGDSDTSWQTLENWSHVVEGDPPQAIQRVPQEGDLVVVANPAHGPLVELQATTPALGGLTVAEGMHLRNNVYQLLVQSAAGATTTIRGPGTQLSLRDPLPNDDVPELLTDVLRIEDGAAVLLDDALSAVHSQLQLGPGARLGGIGDVRLGNDSTPAGAVVLDNGGTLFWDLMQTTEPYFNVTAVGGGVLDLDGTSESGSVLVDDGTAREAEMNIHGPLADPFSGTIRVGTEDHLRFSQDAHFRNATVDLASDSAARAAYLHAMRFSQPRHLVVDGPQTRLSVSGGRGLIEGIVDFREGTFDVDGTLALAGQFNFGPDFDLDLGDADELRVHYYVTDFVETGIVETVINQDVINLDGDAEDTHIHVNGDLTINATAIDDNGTNAFNGKMTVNDLLTVNVPGGWEFDGELISRGGTIGGSAVVFDEATLRLSSSSFGFVTAEEVVFTENVRVIFSQGGRMNFFREDNVTIHGGVWEGEGGERFGQVEFGGNVTIAGPTTMRLQEVNVSAPFDAIPPRLTIEQPLTLDVEDVRFGPNPARWGETIEIGPEGQLRMIVRGAEFVSWNVNRNLLLNGRTDGGLTEHLAGADARILGNVRVTGGSALLPRVHFENRVVLGEGALLRLDGGGSRIGTTNRILDAQILGKGTLAASAGSGLAGHGTIAVPVAFDPTDSLLAAEGGPLTVTGPVESIHSIAAYETTLAFEGPWNAAEVARVTLDRGTIRAQTLPVAGEVIVSSGPSVLDVEDLQIAASSSVHLNGDLTIRGNATIAAGTRFSGNRGLTVADSSTLVLADGLDVPAPLVNHGTLTLGDAADLTATVRLDDYEQSTTGGLEIDLAGDEEGSFDRLEVNAAPHLAGELRVSLLDGYHPKAEDRFTILAAASPFIGEFDSIILPSLQPGFDWSVEYLKDQLTLAAVGTAIYPPGDYDASGLVEQADLDLVLSSWGKSAAEAPATWVHDLPDGHIDQDELDQVLLGWGQSSAGRAAAVGSVPEPGSAYLSIAASLTGLLSWTRRKRGDR